MEPPPPEFFINPPTRALDWLMQIADALMPIANAPLDDPDRFIQRPIPPSLKDTQAFPQWRKAFKDLANNGPGFTIPLENLNVWLTTVQSHASLRSQKKWETMQYQWEMYVHTMEPGISSKHIWHSDVILKYGQKFLPVLVSFLSFFFFDYCVTTLQDHIAHGSKGKKSIRASTLQEYMMFYSWCSTRNSRDLETTNVNGIYLLTKKGMLNMLNDQLHHCKSFSPFLSLHSCNLSIVICTSNLNHHQDERVYFGQYKIKLMIKVGLQKSASSRHMMTIWSFCILLRCFYTILQPGSLGFSFNEHLRDGQVCHYTQSSCLSTPPP